MNTNMTVRLRQEDKDIIAKYAETKGRSISDIVREAILDHIEDELALALYRRAIEENRKGPVSYSLEETAKRLDIEL